MNGNKSMPWTQEAVKAEMEKVNKFVKDVSAVYRSSSGHALFVRVRALIKLKLIELYLGC